MGRTNQGAPGPSGTPWWVVLPSEHPQAHLRPIGCLLVQKKSSKSFAAFGLFLALFSYNVKNMQKTATGTGHYVNRLVPKNDIKYKMIVKHPRMII